MPNAHSPDAGHVVQLTLDSTVDGDPDVATDTGWHVNLDIGGRPEQKYRRHNPFRRAVLLTNRAKKVPASMKSSATRHTATRQSVESDDPRRAAGRRRIGRWSCGSSCRPSQRRSRCISRQPPEHSRIARMLPHVFYDFATSIAFYGRNTFPVENYYAKLVASGPTATGRAASMRSRVDRTNP